MLTDGYKENLPPVTGVLMHGYNTFNLTISNKYQFSSKIKNMKEAVDRLTLSNVELDEVHMDPATWAAPDKAPCTFIEVLKERTFTIGMFIVKPGFKIPLHNHPNTYGFLKVLNGSAVINSYTPYTPKQIVKSLRPIDRSYFLDTLKESSYVRPKNEIKRQYAKFHSSKLYNAKSPAFSFTPIRGNYHEIRVHNKPTVFFDVMSPCYETPNMCKYYKINKRMYTRYVELEAVPAPTNFYYDNAPYTHTFSM